jgi:hypothetical protein
MDEIIYPNLSDIKNNPVTQPIFIDLKDRKPYAGQPCNTDSRIMQREGFEWRFDANGNCVEVPILQTINGNSILTPTIQLPSSVSEIWQSHKPLILLAAAGIGLYLFTKD